jgi:hypothetical protein
VLPGFFFLSALQRGFSIRASAIFRMVMQPSGARKPMSDLRPRPRHPIRQALFYLALLILAAHVVSVFVHHPFINSYDRARFADMVYGKAHRPFVSRALLPMAVRAIVALIPPGMRRFVNDDLGNAPALRDLLPQLLWEREFLTEYAVACVLMFLALIGFALALGYLIRGVYRAPEGFVMGVQLASLIILPSCFKYGNYLYDFPTLLLFTLGLGLMVRRKWRAYLAVFALACLNKETTILLTMIFWIHFFSGGSSRGAILRLAAAQFFLFALVKGALSLAFSKNPGSFVEFHLIDHNLALFKHLSLAQAAQALGLVLAVGLLVFRGWRRKPAFLRHALWIMVPLLALALLLGYLDELRDYYEAYPILLLLAAQTLAELRGLQLQDRATEVKSNTSIA